MQWLELLDRRGRVNIAAAQAAGVRARFELSHEDTDRAAWAVEASGRRYSGAGAIFASLAAALDQPLLISLYSWLPAQRLSELAYRWVARNRHSFPGVIPYCRQPGRSCPET